MTASGFRQADADQSIASGDYLARQTFTGHHSASQLAYAEFSQLIAENDALDQWLRTNDN